MKQLTVACGSKQAQISPYSASVCVGCHTIGWGSPQGELHVVTSAVPAEDAAAKTNMSESLLSTVGCCIFPIASKEATPGIRKLGALEEQLEVTPLRFSQVSHQIPQRRLPVLLFLRQAAQGKAMGRDFVRCVCHQLVDFLTKHRAYVGTFAAVTTIARVLPSHTTAHAFCQGNSSRSGQLHTACWRCVACKTLLASHSNVIRFP